MGERGTKRLITVFAEAMSRVASRQSRVSQAIGDDTKADGANKSHLRNQKQFHSRYNFGYGILLYIRKTPYFCPKTTYFGDFEGVFSYKNDKSASLCPTKTEVADFVRLRVQSFKELILLDKLEFDS